jgi:hypothetical protein
MYDKGKILPGLLIFVALVTAPFWWNPLFGTAGTPQPKPPADTKLQCVLPKQEMRAKHMQVIYDWRETVVREGDHRTWTAPDGRTFQMSLSNTCLTQCHEKKSDFCDQCHHYLAVQPFCWDCHLVPKETT